jgi:carbon monoxide dehydrogenase subunit G
MPVVRRSRIVAAPPERVWEVVSDPHHMPRWWPLVKRMEGVGEDQFTQVLTTQKGRLVRADFRVLVSEPPGVRGGAAARRVWEQEMEGTPFERFLDEALTEIVLEPQDGATRVTIALTQKLHGYSRTGGFLLRRATRTRLDEALAGLERTVTGS